MHFKLERFGDLLHVIYSASMFRMILYQVDCHFVVSSSVGSYDNWSYIPRGHLEILNLKVYLNFRVFGKPIIKVLIELEVEASL